MPNEGERETVSVEAHERIKSERDEWKAKANELSQVSVDLGRLNSAYNHFKAQETPDPYGLAQAAIQNINVRDAEPDEFPGKLDAWFSERVKMFGTPKPENVAVPESPESDDDAPAVQPPRPNMAGPNPAAPGEPVTTGGRLTPGDAEYKEILQSEGLQGIRRLEREGRVERHPDNPYRNERR